MTMVSRKRGRGTDAPKGSKRSRTVGCDGKKSSFEMKRHEEKKFKKFDGDLRLQGRERRKKGGNMAGLDRPKYLKRKNSKWLKGAA